MFVLVLGTNSWGAIGATSDIATEAESLSKAATPGSGTTPEVTTNVNASYRGHTRSSRANNRGHSRNYHARIWAIPEPETEAAISGTVVTPEATTPTTGGHIQISHSCLAKEILC